MKHLMKAFWKAQISVNKMNPTRIRDCFAEKILLAIFESLRLGGLPLRLEGVVR